MTEETVRGVAKMIALGETPPPIVSKQCDACSLKEVCRPWEAACSRSARQWVEDEVARVTSKEGGYG